MLLHRAFPQRKAEELAAGPQRHAVAGRVQAHRADVVGGGHELARRLRAVRRRANVDAARQVRGRVEQPQLGAALVDHVLAIGLCVARIEVGVRGVALHVGAVGPAGVEVAHALEVGQEVHARADPHRARDVALQLGHAAELAAARSVDPQVAGGAAPVALPARRVGGVAADDLRLVLAHHGPEGEVVHLPQRQHLRCATFGRNRERAVVAEEGLAMRRDEQDVAGGRPAAHQRVRAEPGEAARRAALGGHHVDLGVMFIAADESEPAAVGRHAGGGRLGQPGREAARQPAGQAHLPEVVVGDEGEGVPVQGRVAQVGSSLHGRIAFGPGGRLKREGYAIRVARKRLRAKGNCRCRPAHPRFDALAQRPLRWRRDDGEMAAINPRRPPPTSGP